MSIRSEAEIRQEVREVVVSLAPDPSRADLADPALVDDLGYQSLALLELAFALEDEYVLPPIDQEAALAIRTLADIQDYVVAQLLILDGGGGEP